MSSKFDERGLDKKARAALRELELRRDLNVGGMLLEKRMVHRSGKEYDRKRKKQLDRRWDYA